MMHKILHFSVWITLLVTAFSLISMIILITSALLSSQFKMTASMLIGAHLLLFALCVVSDTFATLGGRLGTFALDTFLIRIGHQRLIAAAA